MDPQLYRQHAEQEEQHWWFAGRRDVIAACLRRWVPERGGRTLLDVGCGTGGMLPLLAQFGHVTGVESEPAALAVAARRVSAGVAVQAGALPDDLPDGPFDVVTAFDVVEHVPTPVESLKSMARRLRADGRLVVTVPAFMFLWSQHDELNHHYVRYTDALLREQLQAAGLDVLHTSYFNAWLFPAVAAVRAVQRVLPGWLRGPAKSDLGLPPALVNRALHALFASEASVVARARLPAGVSLLAVARPRSR